jgi:hypothetical protein
VEARVEFSIDEHIVGNPANIQGAAIVGVEIITHANPAISPTYRFYRAKAETAPTLDDPNATAKCVAVKVLWEDPADPRHSISAFYASMLPELVSSTVPTKPIDGQWLWMLQQANGQNRLIYQLDPGSGTGRVCDDLLAVGIDCATTDINAQKITCVARGCPT